MHVLLAVVLPAAALSPTGTAPLFARPSRGEPGCYFYPHVRQWPAASRWEIEDYVGFGPPFKLPKAPAPGCPEPAPAYENATLVPGSGARTCLPLGTRQTAAQAAGEVNPIPGAEPSAGFQLRFPGGTATGCGIPRTAVFELRCDPAADPTKSLRPVSVVGSCSPEFNGSYTFSWSSSLACPVYDVSTACPPSPPQPPPPPPGPGQPWPPHPTANWGAPTWRMAMSTLMMPCNTSGWFDTELASQSGIVDFDWSNARAIWANQHPMDDNGLLLQQAAMVKARSPSSHVWIYRNLVKALSWYKDVGEKLADPQYAPMPAAMGGSLSLFPLSLPTALCCTCALCLTLTFAIQCRRYSGWFLHFRPGGAVGLPNGSYYSSPCTATKCSSLFHSQDQTPSHTIGRKECVTAECDCGAVPCGEYLWDHRNASLRQWLIHTHVLGPDGLGNPNVSGFYFDDAWRQLGFPFTGKGAAFNASDCSTGPSEIEQHCLLDMGLRAEDVVAVTDGWKQTMREVLMGVISAGGWAWPLLTGLDIGRKDPEYCKRIYRNSCAAEDTRMTLTLMTLKDPNEPGSFVDAKSDVASFLVARGPWAYLG